MKTLAATLLVVPVLAGCAGAGSSEETTTTTTTSSAPSTSTLGDASSLVDARSSEASDLDEEMARTLGGELYSEL
ncbi:hypothetical protein L6241_10075 [Janibacter sp. Y6]|uniref:hypothetical protein n=1 Tax=Janibacter sp. Y6 TaxID=2913552 RepID=UPI0034A2DE42